MARCDGRKSMDSQLPPQKFSRADTFTIKMQATPEQIAALKERSANVPTLYFLDNCVVQATKLSEAQLENDKSQRKAKIVEHLKSIDRPQHGISYLFALMEKVSDTRGTASDDELEERILNDLKAMRAFFEHAKVYEPDEFVVQFLRELRRTPIELQRSNYLSFLESINDNMEIREPVNPLLRFERAEKIVALAFSLGIYQQHPVVTIALACLYGNNAARRLLKLKENPAKFNAENVLADVMAITRFAKLMLTVETSSRSGGKFLRTDFITDDEGLIGVFGCFRPESMIVQEVSEGTATEFNLTVELKKLLTEIDADEYEKVFQLLDSPPASK